MIDPWFIFSTERQFLMRVFLAFGFFGEFNFAILALFREIKFRETRELLPNREIKFREIKFAFKCFFFYILPSFEHMKNMKFVKNRFLHKVPQYHSFIIQPVLSLILP